MCQQGQLPKETSMALKVEAKNVRRRGKALELQQYKGYSEEETNRYQHRTSAKTQYDQTIIHPNQTEGAIHMLY